MSHSTAAEPQTKAKPFSHELTRMNANSFEWFCSTSNLRRKRGSLGVVYREKQKKAEHRRPMRTGFHRRTNGWYFYAALAEATVGDIRINRL
jgi:hypothetical protein